MPPKCLEYIVILCFERRYPKQNNVETNTTAYTTKDVNKFINNVLESSTITKEASFRLKISDATTPQLCGLIVSFTDSPAYGLDKEWSLLLKPLIGKPKHHVKNSSGFASPVIHELLQTDEIMVSFDVVSLFTQVPIHFELNIAKQRLQSDSELSLRTGLSTTDLIKGLEIFLNSTNFMFRGKHYKQVFGTAMGSPVSVVANLVMENIETRALETFVDPPRLWKRCVDGTFVIMKRSKLSEFLTHVNTIESSIQFTMEKEKGCQPFLDVLIKRSPSGHLLSAACCKPTHSDRYLNFRSEHPIQHKQTVVNTLLERAKKLLSTVQT